MTAPGDPQDPADAERVLRSAHAAFNARDVEMLLALMHPAVVGRTGWKAARCAAITASGRTELDSGA
jgi:hypothetical protein